MKITPGEYLKLLRIITKTSQKELAEKTSYSQIYISNIENNKIKMSTKFAKIAAHELGEDWKILIDPKNFNSITKKRMEP